MPRFRRAKRTPSVARTLLWLLVRQAIGRIALYLALFPLHFTLSGLSLTAIAVKAADGDTDAVFWLAFAWVAIQMLGGLPTMVIDGLALAFVALQAVDSTTDWIFWICFAWVAGHMFIGGATRRAIKLWHRRRGSEDEQSRRQDMPVGLGLEWFLQVFRSGGPPWPEHPDVEHPDVPPRPARSPADEHLSPLGAQGREELVRQLERLGRLYESGVLTDEEFQQAKRRLLE